MMKQDFFKVPGVPGKKLHALLDGSSAYPVQRLQCSQCSRPSDEQTLRVRSPASVRLGRLGRRDLMREHTS